MMSYRYLRAVNRVSALTSVLLLLSTGAASGVSAQAICSAPHSSPTLARGGSIGTLPRGQGWAMLSALRQSSSTIFNEDGDRQPLLADGRFRTTSLYLSAGAGLARGLDAWFQIPVHSMRYADQGGSRTRVGIGDARFALRVSPAAVGIALPVALRVGLKVPGSSFPLDATVIPLTEGQRDVELSIESGRTLGHGGSYMLGWIGQRWRAENRTAARKPGDERFAHAAIGARVGSTRFELGGDALVGGAPRQLGFDVTSAKRRIVQLAPTIGRRVGRGDLELTSIVPLTGRNLPTGPAISVGYRIAWGESPSPASIPEAFRPKH